MACTECVTQTVLLRVAEIQRSVMIVLRYSFEQSYCSDSVYLNVKGGTTQKLKQGLNQRQQKKESKSRDFIRERPLFDVKTKTK